jgi:hypothetical protein
MNFLTLDLKALIKRIDDPRQSMLLQIYEDYKDLFHSAPGSSHNHQHWTGGYADHIAETLRINEETYDALNTIRPMPFTKGSAAVCLFFHDMEKPFKYADPSDSRVSVWHSELQYVIPGYWEHIKKRIILDLMTKYGFDLSAEEWNALKYTHGEGDDYRKDMRVSTPLAAHVGNCDRWSARGWPEDGQGLG